MADRAPYDNATIAQVLAKGMFFHKELGMRAGLLVRSR